MTTPSDSRLRSGERRFYTGMSLALLAVVFVGFSRSQPLRLLVSGTAAWLAFATWAVGLVG